MRIDEIERSAANNRPLPDYLTAPEMCLYESLRALYSSFRRNELSREAAKVEKQRMIGKCQQFEDDMDNALTVYKARQDNIRCGGTLLSEIEKSVDVADIAIKACEYIGLMTGDREFAARQKNKIEEV